MIVFGVVLKVKAPWRAFRTVYKASLNLQIPPRLRAGTSAVKPRYNWSVRDKCRCKFEPSNWNREAGPVAGGNEGEWLQSALQSSAPALCGSDNGFGFKMCLAVWGSLELNYWNASPLDWLVKPSPRELILFFIMKSINSLFLLNTKVSL